MTYYIGREGLKFYVVFFFKKNIYVEQNLSGQELGETLQKYGIGEKLDFLPEYISVNNGVVIFKR
jgi:hypothetical protein